MEKSLTEASYDLSAAAVQNARNKDFYRARFRRRRTLKRICNFWEIPLTRLSMHPTVRTVFINLFFSTPRYPLAILWDDVICSLCHWLAFEDHLLVRRFYAIKTIRWCPSFALQVTQLFFNLIENYWLISNNINKKNIFLIWSNIICQFRFTTFKKLSLLNCKDFF